MASPPAPSADTAPQATEAQKNTDVDAEMEDINHDPPVSSSSADHSNTAHGEHASTNRNDNNHTETNDDAATTTADARSPAPTDAAQTQTQTQTQSQSQPQPTIQSSSLPPPQASRKDVTLREFLSKMDDYAPIIPDAVTAHYLTLAGLPPPSAADPSGASTGTTPLPLARLLALATQKFVADVAADAYQYSRIRASNTSAAASNALALGGPGGPGGGPGGAGVGVAGGVVGGVGVGAVGGGGVGGTGKAGQNTQLGVQRAGFGGGGQGGSGQGKTVLTMEDLGMAVQEYGVNVKRGEFYR